ncbi:MAG: hypothetical protein ACRED8_01215 [Caulobacteraceae bacterium]
MPLFTIVCRHDAWSDYVAEIEAGTPEEAARLAEENHHEYAWEHEETVEFDARLYFALDEDGEEMEETVCGDTGKLLAPTDPKWRLMNDR